MLYFIPIFYTFILAAIILAHDKNNSQYKVNRKVLYTVPLIVLPFVNIAVAIYYFYLVNKLDKEKR